MSEKKPIVCSFFTAKTYIPSYREPRASYTDVIITKDYGPLLAGEKFAWVEAYAVFYNNSAEMNFYKEYEDWRDRKNPPIKVTKELF